MKNAGARQPSKTSGIIIRQSRRALFHQLVGISPLVVLVRKGTKKIEACGDVLVGLPGELVILPENVSLSIENMPGEDGIYEAHAIRVERDVFERAYQALSLQHRNDDLKPVKLSKLSRDIEGCFYRISGDSDQVPPLPKSIGDLRHQELITWLAESGAVLAPARSLTLADRLRSLVAKDLSHPWSAADAAHAFSMSEPTFRRKLASEGSSFLSVLKDTRMMHALGLLQTTDWTVATIAGEVGYDSPSRFAVRFRSRFGLAPAEIRLPKFHIDRNGTNFDQSERVRRHG